jgi:hypothetical protein
MLVASNRKYREAMVEAGLRYLLDHPSIPTLNKDD